MPIAIVLHDRFVTAMALGHERSDVSRDRQIAAKTLPRPRKAHRPRTLDLFLILRKLKTLKNHRARRVRLEACLGEAKSDRGSGNGAGERGERVSSGAGALTGVCVNEPRAGHAAA